MMSATPTSHTDTELLDDAQINSVDLFLAQDGIRFLRRFLTVFFFAILAILAGRLSVPAQAFLAPEILTSVACLFICAICYALLRMNRVTAGLRVLFWSLGVLGAVSPALISGINTPALYLLPLVLITAGWLLGPRQTIALTMLYILSLALMLVAEHNGWRPPSEGREISVYGASLTISCLLGTLLGLNAAKAVRNQVRRIARLSNSIRQRIGELEESQARVATFFHANPLPASTGSQHGHLNEVNDAWVATFGIAREAAIGHSSEELGLFIDAANYRRGIERLLAAGRLDAFPADLRIADGQIRHFWIYSVVLKNETDGELIYLTNYLDQTDRLAAEAAQLALSGKLEGLVAERRGELSSTLATLESTREELIHAERLASLGSLVAGVSHELNTPIGNMLMSASTLQARVGEFSALVDAGNVKRSSLSEFVDGARDAVALTMRSATRSSELIASFKQLAVDQTSERKRSFDLRQVVDDVLVTLRPGMRHQALTITVDIAPGLQCDSFPGPLGQVLTNLVQNAAVHAFVGREQGNIHIAAKAEGEMLELEVNDDGCGMDVVTLHRIFDPFFTTQLGKGGSGLGLSICHGIAERILGGTLTATSMPDQGSCFSLSFPRQAPDAVPSPGHLGPDGLPYHQRRLS